MKRATLFEDEEELTYTPKPDEALSESETETGIKVHLRNLPSELVPQYLGNFPKGTRAVPDDLNKGRMMLVQDIKRS